MKFLIPLMLLLAFSSNAQMLKYKHGDRIYDSKGEKLNRREVELLLADKPELRKKYISGREKRGWGTVLLASGIGLAAGDLAIGLLTATPYPTSRTIIGGALFAVGLPIKIGHRRKIQDVVKEYNQSLIVGDRTAIDKIDFVANQNGAGVRIQF